jgi:hypothetical protein
LFRIPKSGSREGWYQTKFERCPLFLEFIVRDSDEPDLCCARLIHQRATSQPVEEEPYS